MSGAITSLVQLSGLAALGLLLVTLGVSPLGRAVMAWGRASAAQVSRVRRRFGIASALCALLHATCAATLWLRGPLALLLEWSFLRAGVAALVVLALLLATSFPRVVQRLRLRTWKELHRLAYVALALALQHFALSPNGSRQLLLAALALSVLLVLARLRLRRAPRGAAP